jgi:hypothetical protein
VLRGFLLVVLALSVAVVAGYIEVYVEDGPDLWGLNIYAWDGVEWVPVGVTYVPDYIDTYIVAAGQWASMPYYDMSRYILEIPSEALTHNPPDTPPGLEKWTLEVQNGTRRVVVELAVGKTPIAKGNLTLTTWYSLGDQPPKTPNRGRFINPPRSPPKNNAADRGRHDKPRRIPRHNHLPNRKPILQAGKSKKRLVQHLRAGGHTRWV